MLCLHRRRGFAGRLTDRRRKNLFPDRSRDIGRSRRCDRVICSGCREFAPKAVSHVHGATPRARPRLKTRGIAFGNGVPFLLSPRGEEGTHRISDGKVRGSNGSDVCFRKQCEAARPPHPPAPAARAPPSPRWGEGMSRLGSNAIALASRRAIDSDDVAGRVPARAGTKAIALDGDHRHRG